MTLTKHPAIFLALTSLLATSTGCLQRGPASVELWINHDRFGAPPARGGELIQLYDRESDTLHLQGAIGEVLGVRLGIGAQGNVDVRVAPFVRDDGECIAGNVTLYRTHYVEIDRWPGWHIKRVEPQRRKQRAPDVLVPAGAPRGGLPARCAADRVLDLWADVRVPRGAAPGAYTGRLDLLVNDRVVRSLTVDLTVWPFVLPADAGAELIVDLEQRSLFRHHVVVDGIRHGPPRILAGDAAASELEAVLGSTMRLLERHGLSPHLPWLYPVVKIDSEASLTVDWSDYERVTAPYVDGSAYADRQAPRSWQLPLDESFPEPPAYGALQSPTYSKMLSEYAASASAYAARRGSLDRSYARIPNAQKWSEPAIEATHHFGYLVHRSARGLRTLSSLFPQDMSGAGWHGFVHEDLRDDVDIWSPAAQFFDAGAIARDLGAGIRFQVDRPPFSGSVSAAAPAVDTRVIPMQGLLAEAEAVHLGLANPWPKAPRVGEDTTPQECIDHDPNALIYPGSTFGLTEPVPSIRLKRLRRGLQDAAYMRLLESRGRGHVAQTLAKSLVTRFGSDAYGAYVADGRNGGWIEEPLWWEIARRIAIDELTRTLQSAESDRAEPVPASMRWSRFMEATRGIDMNAGGVRIRLGDNSADAVVGIECGVEVANRRRAPLDGEVRFGALPLGFTPARGLRRLRPLSPGDRCRVILEAAADSLTWGDRGVLYLPIELRTDDNDNDVFRGVARMCHVTAQTLEADFELDGDLGDWPVAMGNHAGDFVLLTGEGAAAGSDVPASRPVRDTHCYVGMTRDKIVFAVRCAIDPNQRGSSVRSSAIEPDDLVTTGEDTVEILLDPSNAGTRSPADLYRIVVRGGGVVWERGVEMTPPAGPSGAWAAEIRHVVRTSSDYWSAEIAVPLEAFEARYRAHSVWGVNFVRFDAAANESSNWAGAVGNVYDPITLGNMTLP